jgi:hypothetical protein
MKYNAVELVKQKLADQGVEDIHIIACVWKKRHITFHKDSSLRQGMNMDKWLSLLRELGRDRYIRRHTFVIFDQKKPPCIFFASIKKMCDLRIDTPEYKHPPLALWKLVGTESPFQKITVKK